jgi:hypothetical protein
VRLLAPIPVNRAGAVIPMDRLGRRTLTFLMGTTGTQTIERR